MKRLLVRCDDFGSAPGANKAILQLAESGLTLNVSVMVCGPEGNKDLKALAQFAPRVALGIHAAVNAEWDTIKWGPVGDKARARAGGLVDAQGHFLPHPKQLSAIAPEVTLDEVRAQIRLGLDWGIPFSYLDEHMFFGWAQNLREPLAALAKEFGLIYRPALASVRREKTDAGLVASWRGGLKSIDSQPQVLITHPALDDASTRLFLDSQNPPGIASRERQAEFEALGSSLWRETLHDENVKPITYPELADEEGIAPTVR